jgi:transposase
MNFCSIEEAWGNKLHVNSDSEKSEKSEKKNNKNFEHFKPTKLQLNKNKKKSKPKSKFKIPINTNSTLTETELDSDFTDTVSHNEMKEILRKVLKSRKCKKYLLKRFRPPLYLKLIDILEENKDIFVLLLVGICIVLFFNLIYNLNR